MKRLIIKKQKYSQKVATVFLLVMLMDIVTPTLTLALTGGPAAPEFSSFEPVTTTSMVNEFSGDFTYNIPVLNIPGPNGGGYAMSLSYHSGETLESEATWVGYGWTLNAGAINRNKIGFADDTKNDRTYYNDVPTNWTASVGISNGFELLSADIPTDFGVQLNASIRYNNYKGFGYTVGAGLNYREGLASLGYSLSDGSGSFSASINPAKLLGFSKERKKFKELRDVAKSEETEDCKKEALDKLADYRATIASSKKSRYLSGSGSSYGIYLSADRSQPSTVTSYYGRSYYFNVDPEANPIPFLAGADLGFSASYTEQDNIAETNITALGYLYSSEGASSKSAVMDYSVEKESMYDKRDQYLSLPFNSADNFSLTGEGVSGGFRFYTRTPGHFRPNKSLSVTSIQSYSGEGHIGVTNGSGFVISTGLQTLKVNGEEWDGTNSLDIADRQFKSKDNGDEAFFLRFNGDLGGDVLYGNDDYVAGNLVSEGASYQGNKQFKINIPDKGDVSLTSSIATQNGSVSRSGRSSHIAYTLNSEMLETGGFKYQMDNPVVDGEGINRASYLEQIGELITTNESGNQYVYGLPVYVKNETRLQYDLRGIEGGSVNNNLNVVKENIEDDYNVKVGYVDNGAYANNFLLTQITTPDYVDRTMNGPTEDDFGGYTKFEYEKVHKLEDGGYHFRMPYTGLNYDKGMIYDPFDDVGSYFSGDKEVYLLKYIKTKSHTAVFETELRKDGRGASSDIKAAGQENGGDLDANNKYLKKLVSIKLYANDENGEWADGKGTLIRTVRFDYDYSLCKNVWNNAETNEDSGKLTLKNVWFEHQNIVNARIAPYTFNYNYPTSAEAKYPDRYKSFQDDFGDKFSAGSQNPNYDPHAIDAWGNYQDAARGAVRNNDLISGVDQTPAASFDPAAWQLKAIILPSGGEIHVQYEQDDYCYVQDRLASALVSIAQPPMEGIDMDELNNSSDPDNYDLSNVPNFHDSTVNIYFNPEIEEGPTAWDIKSTYQLKVNEIGVITEGDMRRLAKKLNDNLEGKKIYFKFLYSLLLGTNDPEINGSCNSEYLTGYVNFRKAYVTATDERKLMIRIGPPSGTEYSLPRNACVDLVRKQIGGKLDGSVNCDPNDGIKKGTNPKRIAMQLISKIGVAFVPQLTTCLRINDDLSFFKIPMLNAKKGGGIRVKRILMYAENGIDEGVPALYGTQYLYQNENGESSGVATNEPATIREENPLVTFLGKREEQTWATKVIAGKDRAQFEGPIGESLLPSPSIGYRRVISENIHSGKTHTGFVESIFATVQDFPFDREYDNLGQNGVDNTMVTGRKDWMRIPAIVLNYSVTNKWAAQGYRFIKNSMHGKPKTIKTYTGVFKDGDLENMVVSSSTTYEYFEPGDNVPLMMPDGTINPNGTPGKEMDITFERRQVEDVTYDFAIDVDYAISLPALPQASLLPIFSYTESKLRTHTTTKVITYPAISKAVTTVKDGISHRVENKVFSSYTGQPVITSTTDGFEGLSLNTETDHNGTYIAYSYPGFSQYPELGQKAINDGYVITANNGDLIISYVNDNNIKALDFSRDEITALVCDDMNMFTVGDLIILNDRKDSYFHVSSVQGNKVIIAEALLTGTGTSPLSDGDAINKIKIVKSGKTNQLGISVGGFVTYGVDQYTDEMPSAKITKAIYDERLVLADALTSLIADGGSIDPDDFQDLRIINPETGLCGSLEDIEVIPASRFVSDFTVSYGSTEIIEKVWDPNVDGEHPMVTHLNNLMNTYWKYELTSYSGSLHPLADEGDQLVEKLYTTNALVDVQNSIDVFNYVPAFPSVNGGNSRTISLSMIPDDNFSNSTYPNGSNVTGLKCPGTPYICTSTDETQFLLASLNLEYDNQTIFKLWVQNNFEGSTDRKRVSSPCSNPYTNSGSVDQMFGGDFNYTSGVFGQDTDGYLTLDGCVNIGSGVFGPEIRFVQNVQIEPCTQNFEESGGEDGFSIDEYTGQLVYLRANAPCNPIPVTCIQFCDPPQTQILNVVSSSAAVLSNYWPYDNSLYGDVVNGNEFETGVKGTWRPLSNYVYNTDDVIGATDGTERNYKDAGTYTLNLFNWKVPTASESQNWVKANTVTKYSPNGEALEEKDAIGIYSTAKFGYKNAVPYLVAQNSKSDFVSFESFENVYDGTKVEDGVTILSSNITSVDANGKTIAHSGSKSYKVDNFIGYTMGSFNADAKISESGIGIKVWVKNVVGVTNPIKGGLRQCIGICNDTYVNAFTKVAQSGEWSLYELKIDKSNFVIGQDYIVFVQSNSTSNIYIDDIRMQPLNAQVNTFVYDPTTLRLLTSFDDQNFGLYYQYNAEGRLVRKIIETERGMKTVTETQYNTPLKVERSDVTN